MRRCHYPIVHPSGEHLPKKEMIRKQREIKSVRTICEQIGIRVGHVNK